MVNIDNAELPDGVWATAALHKDLVIIVTDSARVIGIDKITGKIRWEFLIQGPLWSSPVVIDEFYCKRLQWLPERLRRERHKYKTERLWRFPVGNGCLEATPAVWDGKIIIGKGMGKSYDR
ncbi:MAG: hypothetical protein Ct9H90mP11_05830 [Acidimicrobiales bacterium]|nr:MAG: hypothetical protein Ct9H90mP11_05830 [Acidimicrobiales bacterium]